MESPPRRAPNSLDVVLGTLIRVALLEQGVGQMPPQVPSSLNQPVILRDSERLFPDSLLFETNINILTVFLLNKCFQEMIESMGSEE